MRMPTKSTGTRVNREVQPGVWLDARRALWFEETRVLAMADLHWGYAAAHRSRGNLLPLWGDEAVAERLDSLLSDYAVAEMLWVGDVVHAAEGAAAAERYLRSAPAPITVLAGNHDRRWSGKGETTARRGRYFFHHGDVAHPIPVGCIEVIGHHHPAASIGDGAGGKLKLPALVVDTERLVMPAFSPWAAGADCSPLLSSTTTVWAISPQRIFAVSAHSRTPAA